METEIVRHLLEQLEGRFSFYRVNGCAIESKVGSSGKELVFSEEDVKKIIDMLLERSGIEKRKGD